MEAKRGKSGGIEKSQLHVETRRNMDLRRRSGWNKVTRLEVFFVALDGKSGRGCLFVPGHSMGLCTPETTPREVKIKGLQNRWRSIGDTNPRIQQPQEGPATECLGFVVPLNQ